MKLNQTTKIPINSKLVNFPKMCPKCLEKTDLTNYNLKWEKNYRKAGLKVTEKAKIDVPICKSCKDTLIATARKENAKFAAIFTPISWGLLYVLLTFFGAANWTGIPLVFLILLAGAPIVGFYYILSPSSTANWSIKFAGKNVFSIENSAYAALFRVANGTYSLSATNISS